MGMVILAVEQLETATGGSRCEVGMTNVGGAAVYS
jgi:hypothetical protein